MSKEIRKRSPDFQMGFRHIRRQPSTHKKGRFGYLLSCHFSYYTPSFIFASINSSSSVPRIVVTFVLSTSAIFISNCTSILVVPYSIRDMVIVDTPSFSANYSWLQICLFLSMRILCPISRRILSNAFSIIITFPI